MVKARLYTAWMSPASAADRAKILRNQRWAKCQRKFVNVKLGQEQHVFRPAWGLSDKNHTWPLDSKYVQNIIDECSDKGALRLKLAKRGFLPKAINYLVKMPSYAAAAIAQREYQTYVDKTFIARATSWNEAKREGDAVNGFASATRELPCPVAHYGMCRKRDAAVLTPCLKLADHLLRIAAECGAKASLQWSILVYFRGITYCHVARMCGGSQGSRPELVFLPCILNGVVLEPATSFAYRRGKVVWPCNVTGMSAESRHGKIIPGYKTVHELVRALSEHESVEQLAVHSLKYTSLAGGLIHAPGDYLVSFGTCKDVKLNTATESAASKLSMQFAKALPKATHRLRQKTRLLPEKPAGDDTHCPAVDDDIVEEFLEEDFLSTLSQMLETYESIPCPRKPKKCLSGSDSDDFSDDSLEIPNADKNNTKKVPKQLSKVTDFALIGSVLGDKYPTHTDNM